MQICALTCSGISREQVGQLLYRWFSSASTWTGSRLRLSKRDGMFRLWFLSDYEIVTSEVLLIWVALSLQVKMSMTLQNLFDNSSCSFFPFVIISVVFLLWQPLTPRVLTMWGKSTSRSCRSLKRHATSSVTWETTWLCATVIPMSVLLILTPNWRSSLP